MASETTAYSANGNWKIKVEAWKNNFLLYKSIGTQVQVYHREQTKNIWGNTVTDWVKKKAISITITNTYKGSFVGGGGAGSVTKSGTWRNKDSAELKEWAFGFTVTLPAQKPNDIGGGAILDIDSVDGVVNVSVEGSQLTAQVSASSIISDSSIW